MKRITTKGLIEGLQKAKNEAQELLKIYDSSLKILQNMAKVFKGEKKALNLEDPKDIEKINTLYSKTTKARKEIIKVDKDRAGLNKQLNDLRDEEVKGRIRLQKANREQRKLLEAEIILENKSIKNKKELTEQLKALRIQGESLDLGSDELKANIAEIDRLTETLKENSDQNVRNKINVGNYKSAIEGLSDSFDDQNKRLKLLVKAYNDLAEQGKENTEEAKELKEAIDDQNKRLKILVKAYNDLVKQGKKNTEEAKELKEAIDDQKKSLESLKGELKKTASAMGKLGSAAKAIGIGLIIAAFAKFVDLLGSSRKASLESDKALANFTTTIKVFFKTIVNSFGGAKEIIVAIAESIESSFIRAEIVLLQLEKRGAKLPKVLGGSPEKVAELNKQIAILSERQEALDNSTNTVAGGVDRISDAWDGFINRTADSVQSQKGFLEQQLATEISLERQTRALAGLAEKRQRLQDISDDDTLGFLTRKQAIEDAEKARIDFADKEEEIALTKERLSILAVKQELLESGIRSKAQLDAIKTGEQLNNLIAQRGVAMEISSDSEAAFTEAFTDRIDKQEERESFLRDSQEKNRKTERDALEDRIDTLNLFAEQEFALNEQLIASDELSLKERQRLAKVNQDISKDLFDETTRLTIEQAKKSINTNKILTKSEKDKALALIDELDVNQLLKETNADIIKESLKKADLGEIEARVLRESIKLRKDQINADTNAQNVIANGSKKNLELTRDIEAQKEFLANETFKNEEKFNEATDKLEKERFENEKKRLEELIKSLPETSNARLEAEKELNDLLISEKERVFNEEKGLNDKRKASAEETEKFLRDQAIKTTQAILDGFIKRSANRQKNIEEDISQAKTREAELLGLAQSANSQVSQLAADSLEEQRRIEREKTKDLEREQAKQRVFEIFKAGLTAYGQNAGEPNAVAKTLGDIGVLIAGLNALGGSFAVGTDRLDANGKGVDGIGGVPIIAHPNEMIIQESLNKKMGFPKREELADVFTRYKNGDLIDSKNASGVLQQVIVHNNNEEMIKQLKAVKDELKNISFAKLILDTQRGTMKIKERKGGRVNVYVG